MYEMTNNFSREQVLKLGESWIGAQALHGISQFDQLMMKSYPESQNSLLGARQYLATIGEVCNYISAVEQIDWEQYLPRDAKVLDVGCGAGWLTAMLSRMESVKIIYPLDSSKYFLKNLLPQVLDLMQGCPEKVHVIEGLFLPLYFDNAQLDVVVASSALHHAESLESVLKEIRRVLKPGGLLFVLNETPWPGYRHWISVLIAALRILRDLLIQRYQVVSPAISASGYLYDPSLGDRDYPCWYWEKALRVSGFDLQSMIDTGLPTVKGGKGRSLIHYVCKAV